MLRRSSNGTGTRANRAFAFAALAAACGGTTIVDPAGEGGAGGAPTITTVTTSSSAAATNVSSAASGSETGALAASVGSSTTGSTVAVNSSNASSGTSGTSDTASSSSGGDPFPGEKPVHGCTSEMATDLTGAGAEITLVPDASGNFTLTVGDTVSLLAYPMCLKITQAQRIRVAGTGTAGSPILVGGTYDSIGDVGVYSKQSPLQPDCYDNVNAVIPACRTGGTWPCGQNMEPAATAAMYCVAPNQKAFEPAAILPFFNLLVKSNNGAVYVLP